MACTCRALPHCPSCNAAVRIPLSALERGAPAFAMLRKVERKERRLPKENLRLLAMGRSPCPVCGEAIEAMHERRCVSDNLGALGVSASDREMILGRISFPE